MCEFDPNPLCGIAVAVFCFIGFFIELTFLSSLWAESPRDRLDRIEHKPRAAMLQTGFRAALAPQHQPVLP
jgi:hypothetical protein